MVTEAIGAVDILRVIVITAFAGGTIFLGIWISKKTKFSDDQILALTAFGAGILISAAIFSMVIVYGYVYSKNTYFPSSLNLMYLYY
jgi:uncharacterized membrane-anchored protein YitT (DUF2179 family)